jgi:predicted HicB family RNase H-like nuclease
MRKRMGRPPKPAGEAKSRYLQIRVEPKEKELFYTAAEAAGVAFSEWARKQLRAASENEVSRTKRREAHAK